MSDHLPSTSSPSARERELEIEVARLQAELDALRGEEPTSATSRFLAMAAATVDQAVADARREADEIVEEISAEAEARRDEATRVAAEAEAMAEQMLADADRAQERIDEARDEAAAITAAAEAEAERVVQLEREKMAEEMAAIADVRATVEEQRTALDSYHEQLQRKVQELAESMVSFMTTEVSAGLSLETPAIPELEAALAQTATVDVDDVGADDLDDVEADDVEDDDVEADDVEHAAGTGETSTGETGAAADLDDDEADEHVTVAEADGDTETDSESAGDDPFDIPPAPPVDVASSPWTEMLESAIPAAEAYPDAVDVPDESIDEIPPGPPMQFAERDIIETADETDDDAVVETRNDAETDETAVDAVDEDAPAPSSSGLFSRASQDEVEGRGGKGLFGMLGSRLVQQTSPDDLADALEETDSDDAAFQEFLTGDDEPDPSRDWLLRNESS